MCGTTKETEIRDLAPQLTNATIDLAKAAHPSDDAELARFLTLFGEFSLTVNPNHIWKRFTSLRLVADVIAKRTQEAGEAGDQHPSATALDGLQDDRRVEDTSNIHATPPLLTDWGIDGVQALLYFEGFIRELLPRAIAVSLKAAVALSRGAAIELRAGGRAVERPFADPRQPLPPLESDVRTELVEWLVSEIKQTPFSSNRTGPAATTKNRDRWHEYNAIVKEVQSAPVSFADYAPTWRGGKPRPFDENIETIALKVLQKRLEDRGEHISVSGLRVSLGRGEEEDNEIKAARGSE